MADRTVCICSGADMLLTRNAAEEAVRAIISGAPPTSNWIRTPYDAELDKSVRDYASQLQYKWDDSELPLEDLTMDVRVDLRGKITSQQAAVGAINEITALNGFLPTGEQLLPRIDEIGIPVTSPHYPVGRAWAGDTPFQWTKHIASHLAAPATVCWYPGRSKQKPQGRCAPNSTMSLTWPPPCWK